MSLCLSLKHVLEIAGHINIKLRFVFFYLTKLDLHKAFFWDLKMYLFFKKELSDLFQQLNLTENPTFAFKFKRINEVSPDEELSLLAKTNMELFG